MYFHPIQLTQNTWAFPTLPSMLQNQTTTSTNPWATQSMATQAIVHSQPSNSNGVENSWITPPPAIQGLSNLPNLPTLPSQAAQSYNQIDLAPATAMDQTTSNWN